MTAPFVPAEFVVPSSLDGDGFRLEPLGPEHNERDHQAWMSSVDHIRSTPGFPKGDWPSPMSLESNLEDLVMHADHFRERVGFTYSILDGDEVIGCLYIYPSDDPAHDAHVTSWVTASRAAMDPKIRTAINTWLSEAWPFTTPSYAAEATPG